MIAIGEYIRVVHPKDGWQKASSKLRVVSFDDHAFCVQLPDDKGTLFFLSLSEYEWKTIDKVETLIHKKFSGGK